MNSAAFPIIILSFAVMVGAFGDDERNDKIEKLQQQVQQLENKEK